MNFYWQDAHFFVELNSLATLAIAMLLYFLGRKICHIFPILERYCIPAAIVGGTTFALFNLVNHQFRLITLIFDAELQTPAMAGFFACAGLGIAKGGIRRSVRGMGLYFGFCVALVVFQNIIGMGLGQLFGIGPALGLMAGSTSMVGGHGTAISLSEELVKQGISNAGQVGVAAATFGLVTGSAIGGPLASLLIRRFKIATPGFGEPGSSMFLPTASEGLLRLGPDRFFKHVALVTLVMGTSSLFAAMLEMIIPSIAIPSSIAAMLLGLLFGYSIKHTSWFKFDGPTLDLISELLLIVFLTEASMSLRLWQLMNLALPLLAILILQVVFILALGYFLVYPAMAKALENRYDSAVIVAGLCGHGLGATPNAIANMDAVCDHYGPSPTAYLIVPMVGGFFLDLVNIPLLLLLLNFVS